MKVFLTGGTGFIGSHVAAVLKRHGYDVLTAARSGADVSLDLTDSSDVHSILAEVRPDAVVHCGWQGLPDYSESMCALNLEAGQRLFDAAGELGVSRMIAAGSCWEYCSRKGKLTEEARTCDEAPFSRAKLELLRHGREVAERTGMKLSWLRLFFVYGPGQREGALLPTLLRSIASEEQVHLRTPDARNDFIHVADVAEAVASVLQADQPQELYNVGSGHATPLGEAVRTVCLALGKEVPAFFRVDRPAQGDDFWADISRISDDTAWAPHISLEQGIADMATLLQENT